MSLETRFLPKTFESCGVICSPLGRRATPDTIVFRQPLPVRLEKAFCFWLDNNIEIRVYPVNTLWVLEVSVFSLTRFANHRSSSLIGDYHGVLLALDTRINSELEKRRQSLVFDAFESEIVRLDLFCDLRFKNKSEMKEFYYSAKEIFIDALPFTTDFDGGFYRHNADTLTTSTELIKLYYKENRERVSKSDELNRNKLRLETSLQNYNRTKVTANYARRVKQTKSSQTVRIDSGDSRIKNNHRVYQNRYAANVFKLLSQDALDTIFYHLSKEILHG